MAKEISYKVMKPMEVLSENNKGYTKEINLVSWNYASAKLDIREWHPEHEKCGKGITLSESEGRKLMEALIKFYAEIDKD
mgnify:FL=1